MLRIVAVWHNNPNSIFAKRLQAWASSFICMLCFLGVPQELRAQDCGSGQIESALKYGDEVFEYGVIEGLEPGRRKGLLRKLNSGTLVKINAAKDTKYIRAFLGVEKKEDLKGNDWVLVIRDSHYRPIQTITIEDFKTSPSCCTDSYHLWTTRVEGRTIFLDLEGEAPRNYPQLSVEEYISVPTNAPKSYYSAKDANNPDYKPLLPLSHKRATSTYNEIRLGDSVGMIMLNFLKRSWVCTGFLIGDDLFMTNWHCGGPLKAWDAERFWDRDIWNRAIIDFSWDNDQISREYGVVGIEASNRERDFVLLRINRLQGSGRLVPLEFKDMRKSIRELKIIHHPLGKPKQISVRCKVHSFSYKSPMSLAKLDFTHDCDTAGGSSGAPIFDQDNNLIGLHHMGYMIKKDGKCDNVNKAIWGNEIRDFLIKNKPDLAGELGWQVMKGG